MQLLQAVTGQNLYAASATNTVIVLSSVAKMFVGELIENGEFASSGQCACLQCFVNCLDFSNFAGSTSTESFAVKRI